jgi:hypothetical protein
MDLIQRLVELLNNDGLHGESMKDQSDKMDAYISYNISVNHNYDFTCESVAPEIDLLAE